MVPFVKGRQPAIVDLDEAREVQRRAETVPAHPVTKLALRLLALTAVRPGEIRGAAWHEFEQLNGGEPLWRIPAARMKMKQEHLVPLSRQAVDLLTTLLRVLTGRDRWRSPMRGTPIVRCLRTPSAIPGCRRRLPSPPRTPWLARECSPP